MTSTDHEKVGNNKEILCKRCSKSISLEGVSFKNDQFHKECFVCTKCESTLSGKRFTTKDERPFCTNCFTEWFADRCVACTKPIVGAKYITFEERHWHNDCFFCSVCKVSLLDKGFITDGLDALCKECAKKRVTGK